jgi:hypothetical protein
VPVDSVSPEYKRYLGKWKRCRDVATGEDAVHDAGTDYLPKLKDQVTADYLAYVKRTPFYNATWRTISGLKGMLFRQPPKIEAPEGIKDYFDDITMSGVPLELFVQDVCEEALKIGRIGILVDYPEVKVTGITMAQALAQNLRPTMQSYEAERIINWRVRRINNKTVLAMVVLTETHCEAVDEFTDSVEDRYRVLDLVTSIEEGKVVTRYRIRIFKKEKKSDILLSESYPLMNGKPIDYIPFIFIGTDDVTPECDDPPLIDLVNLNLSHYRTTADYEHGCHFAGLPQAWIAGFRPENAGDKLYIGGPSAWTFSDPNAKAEYLEFTGQGLESLVKNLGSKEQQMAVLGARMLEPQKKAPEAADSGSIRRKGEESMLSAAAQAISLGVTISLKWFVNWSGGDAGKVEFELNRDFYAVPMTSDMLTALVSGWQGGAYSEQVLFEKLQQGEIISRETTIEEEQQRKADRPPPAPAGARLPGGPGTGPGTAAA